MKYNLIDGKVVEMTAEEETAFDADRIQAQEQAKREKSDMSAARKVYQQMKKEKEL